MAKRTKAQRVAAAKASWERRRKGLPPLSKQRGKKRRGKPAQLPVLEPAAYAAEVGAALDTKTVVIAPPQIVYAVQEGDDVFVCFAADGSLDRKRVNYSNATKLLRELTAILVR